MQSETETKQPIDLSQLSTEDLKKALAEKEKQEKAEKIIKRQEYESQRDKIVDTMVSEASEISNIMSAFKTDSFKLLEEFKTQLLEYGQIRASSKGGFSIRSSKTNQMVSLRRNVISEYDERADTALALLREFLEETIKKKDIQTYRTISALIEKNKAGDINPSRVADLLSVKDNYDDARWTKAMELLTESYREREVSYNIEFYRKNDLGKDEMISLSFASL
jgi:ribosomal protein L31E